MAQTTESRTYDSLLSATLNNTRQQIYDQVSLDNVIWMWLHANGRKKLEDGGYKIQRTVRRKLNGTVRSYSKYEELDTTPQDTETVILEDWRQVAGSVTIARIEERQNSTKHAIYNLLTSKTENLQASISDEMHRQCWALTVGNGGKDINSLPIVVTQTGTSTLHGMDSSAETYWEPQRKQSASDSGSISGAAFMKEVKNVYNNCTKGPGGSPDLGVADQTTWELIESIEDTKVRYGDVRLINAGFDALRIKGMNLTWDERVPDAKNSQAASVDGGSPTHGAIYYFNSRSLELVVDKQTDLINRPFQTAQNQDAKVALVLIYLNLLCTQRKKQGILWGVEYANVS